MQKHLATLAHNSTKPFNHGLVEISDNGYVGETPVEDYGMYAIRNKPFPPSDSQELFDIFIELLRANEDGDEIDLEKL